MGLSFRLFYQNHTLSVTPPYPMVLVIAGNHGSGNPAQQSVNNWQHLTKQSRARKDFKALDSKEKVLIFSQLLPGSVVP